MASRGAAGQQLVGHSSAVATGQFEWSGTWCVGDVPPGEARHGPRALGLVDTAGLDGGGVGEVQGLGRAGVML